MMKKALLIVFALFLGFSGYGQKIEPCRFTVSYYMGLTDYNYTSSDPTLNAIDDTPYTMSGIDIGYNFGHHTYSRTSGGNFDAGLGVYHFSDDVIMGKYGFKLNAGYKYSALLVARKGIVGFIKGTGQLVFSDDSNITLVPRVSAGVNLNRFEVGFFGEYQKANKESYQENIGWIYGNDAYTLGVKVSFSIR